MKRNLSVFILSMLLVSAVSVFSQPATVSYPLAVGRNSNCGSGTSEIHYYTYNGTTNTIANASGGVVGSCIPQLRIGLPANGTQRFTSNLASISFNPADHKIYYFWSSYPPSGPVTYAWSWPAGTCPGTSSNKLDTIRSFQADILGVAFDNQGNGYILEFTSGSPVKAMIRSIDMITGVMGVADTLALTGGAKIWATGSGDVAMSPSGQMFFVVNNKLFTPNYKAYTGTGANITCTYIDTVRTSNNFVGLTYAEGETVAAYSGGGCPFEEIVPLTGANNPITKSGTVYSAADLATIISGIGASKKLVSANATAIPNQFDVTYDIYVQNYGNVDVTNVQVIEDLTQINGVANVLFLSASLINAPSGIALNPLYNGIAINNLLNGTGTLPNYPVSSNNFTIRVKCRLSNIQPYVVYNNNAVVTGTGFNSVSLRDVSTDGSKPDLNTNDKPDDVGENQPTPLLRVIAASPTPCTTLSKVLYKQTFGTGTTLSSAIPIASIPTGKPGPGNSDYPGTTIVPIAQDSYTITNNAATADPSHFITLTDHTGDPNGRMLLVNADANNTILYRDTVAAVCPFQQYSLFFYASFPANAAYQTLCDGFGGFKYPKVTMRIRERTSGLVISQLTTGDIVSSGWNQFGMKFIMPSGVSSLILELMNEGEGGCGNDIAIDDIQFGTCDALPVVSLSGPSSGCLGGNTTFTATVSDPGAIFGTVMYQWQVSSDNVTWANMSGATPNNTYVISSTAASDINKYYRVIIAAAGNLGNVNCQYVSPAYFLTAKATSTAPTSVLKNKASVCPGDPITLKVTGGTLGTNANYYWYTGSCGGTLIGTGPTVNVTPTVATTYYVRIQGDCNTTSCASMTVTFNCDIDIDKDGITNSAESGNVDPIYDNDFDGVLNYRDIDYPGYVDNNGDGINDVFDNDLDGVPNFLDRDSDNDGIPDVVEAGGVDANGDGAIDNYTDTDNDGLSQNVDANNSGAVGSGVGLGMPDLDGDAVPNSFDTDSDNDGIPDVTEAYGTDANKDGKIDGYTDANTNGFSDNVEGLTNALLKTGADVNNDGRADSYPNKNMDADLRANPYDLDSDGDGITDVKEAAIPDTDNNGRIDGAINSKGWSTTVAAMVSLNLPNTDTRGRANVYDIDSDDDGIPDNVEGLPSIAYVLPSGTDSDNDGIDNAYDNFSGFGGNGIPPVDTDGDSVPDYRDSDTDGDGLSDLLEGNDLNFNGLPDDGVALTLADTDGDGLDNFFDNNNSSAKGTSGYMGAGGSISGDSAPGSITTVQHTAAFYGCATERDWRCVGFVLACNITNFTAVLQNNDKVKLDWSLVCDQQVDYFTIERSTDKVSFVTLATYNSKPIVKEVNSYTSLDDITSVQPEIIYYRFKTVDVNGKITYSNIISVKRQPAQLYAVVIAPNPVQSQLRLLIQSPSKTEARFELIDMTGQVVAKYTAQLYKGSNKLSYQLYGKLTEGIYYLRTISQDFSNAQQFTLLK